MRQVAAYIGVFASISAVFVTSFSFYLIKRFTSRPVYSTQRLKEHEEKRARLINELHAQSLTFQTEDGLNLAGLLLIREHAQRNLLVCHGYRMAKERMIEFALMFPDDNIFLFDYRAHGQSDGYLTTIGYHEQKDVLAALHVLQTHEKTKGMPVYGIGVSMGAVSLLGAAVKTNAFNGIILDSPFTRLDQQARRTFAHKFKAFPRYPFEPIGLFLFEYLLRFSPHEVNAFNWAETLSIPILLIHSRNDNVAAFADAQELFQRFKTKKEFWEVAESGHARIFFECSDAYKDHINNFLNTC